MTSIMAALRKAAGIAIGAARPLAYPNAPERPCHLHRLAVSHTGDVFPCCLVYSSAYHRIGNISDVDLAQKIDKYDRRCSCSGAKLRAKRPGDPVGDDRFLNLELSLQCQAECAMCCVDAPGWSGTYDLYPQLTALIREQDPEGIVMQGGEVLVQKRSMDWIRSVREEFPQKKLHLVTNGCAPASLAPEVARLFQTGGHLLRRHPARNVPSRHGPRCHADSLVRAGTHRGADDGSRHEVSGDAVEPARGGALPAHGARDEARAHTFLRQRLPPIRPPEDARRILGEDRESCGYRVPTATVRLKRGAQGGRHSCARRAVGRKGARS